MIWIQTEASNSFALELSQTLATCGSCSYLFDLLWEESDTNRHRFLVLPDTSPSRDRYNLFHVTESLSGSVDTFTTSSLVSLDSGQYTFNVYQVSGSIDSGSYNSFLSSSAISTGRLVVSNDQPLSLYPINLGPIFNWVFANYTPTTIPGMTLAAGSASIDQGLLNNELGLTYWTLYAPNIQTVTLTQFTPSYLNYLYILTTSTGKGLIMLPDGSLQDNVGVSDVEILPAGTLQAGVPYTGTLTLPLRRDFTAFGASPGGGGAWHGTIKAMILRPPTSSPSVYD